MAGSEHESTLWSLLPPRIRWSLAPIFSTALLVGAGEATAKAVYTWIGRADHPTAIADLTAILLLVNLTFALWVFDRVLTLEIEETGKPDIAARVLGLASIFVTIIDLFKLSITPTQDDYIALYGIVVAFYVVVVPFFLIVVRHSPAPIPRREQAELMQRMFRMAVSTARYGVAIGTAVFLFVGLLFAFMNGGLGPFFQPPPVVAWFGQELRNEYWFINPTLLGIATLQFTFIEFARIWGGRGGSSSVRVPRNQKRVIFLTSLFFVVVMSLMMLDADDLVPPRQGGLDPDVGTQLRYAAQAIVAILYWGLFIVSFHLTWRLAPTRRSRQVLLGTLSFLLLGMIAGALVFATRSLLSGRIDYANAHLVYLHGLSFVLAFLALQVAGRLLESGASPLRSLFPADEFRLDAPPKDETPSQ